MDFDESSKESYVVTSEPSFLKDIGNNLLRTIIIILIWNLFMTFLPVIQSFDLIGALLVIGIIIILVQFTFIVISEWLGIFAYKKAQYRTQQKKYMKYEKTCPFLNRHFLTFSCKAEPVIPFEEQALPVFQKCHKKDLWPSCWQDRVQSIIQHFDEQPFKIKRTLITALAIMKQHATTASDKIIEIIKNENEHPEVRVLACHAAVEINITEAVPLIVDLLGEFNPRYDIIVRSSIVKFGNLALPYLTDSLANTENTTKIVVIVEVIGRIGKLDSIQTLKDLFESEKADDYTKLRILYAAQDIMRANQEEASTVVNFFLDLIEEANDEEYETISEILRSDKLITVPLLIESLENEEFSQLKYDRIISVLELVEPETMKKIFDKLAEIYQNDDKCKTLAAILREHAFDQFIEVYQQYLGLEIGENENVSSHSSTH